MRENEAIRSVECPVCRCRVEGSDERELSRCVHVHFCEEHGMVSSSERESKVIAGGQTGYGTDIEREGTRPEPREAPSASELAMQEGSRRTGPAKRSRGGRESMESRKQAREGMEGREMSSRGTASSSSEEYSLAEAYGVQCPGCQERVTGRTEGETSERLREHMTTEHRDEPYMTRLLERLKGSR